MLRIDDPSSQGRAPTRERGPRCVRNPSAGAVGITWGTVTSIRSV